MAGSASKVLDKVLPVVENEKLSGLECAVCLQTCVHPAELPCGHIFCYLCIKGIVNQGRPCAMCRREIPVDYLHKPRLLKSADAEANSKGFEDGHLWFYEGHNGWWQYDERTSVELESAYQKGERSCELLIAGFVYIADLGEMIQYRRNIPNKRRRIKRDLATISKKGVAGLRTSKFTNPVSLSSTAGESNEMTQSWSTTDGPTATNSSPARTYTTTISNTVSEPISNYQQPGERISFGLSHSTSSTTPLNNLMSSAESSTASSRNFDFDNVTNESMDWTVEQIESLNSELINDFEVLFRDVNNCGQSKYHSNQDRPRRVVDNYVTQYLHRNYPLRGESLGNESETNCTDSNLSELSNENNGVEPFPASPRGEFPSEEHEQEKF